MNFLVTGATGSIGPAIVHALCGAGHRVRTLSLDGPHRERIPLGVDQVQGDVTDASTVEACVRGVEGVVHLAGLAHRTEASHGIDKAYERINVGGAATVVDAARRAGVGRVVLASTIAVYGPTGQATLDEQTAPRPDTPYARSKLVAEEILLTARAADGGPLGTVLRLAAVYGANVAGNYQRLVRSLSRHRFVPVGNGLNRRTLVYEDDVAAAVLLALGSSRAAGQVYNVTDGTFHTLREIIAAICAALGRRPPGLALPLTPAVTTARVLDRFFGALALPAPVSVATLLKYSEDVAIEGQRIRQDLGFRPVFGLRTGWQRAIDLMRRDGHL